MTERKSTEALLNEAHMTNLSIRINGEWVEREGDFVKHLLDLQLMIEQLEDMNGEEAFWGHLSRLPVSKFVGSMRKAHKAVKHFTIR